MAGDRKMQAQLRYLHRADGSCLLAQGGTVACAAVFGPMEAPSSKRMGDRCFLDVTVRPAAASDAPDELAGAEALLRGACEAAVLGRRAPRTMVTVTVQEMQSDGDLLAAAVNAACLALLDAAVPLAAVFGAASVGVDRASRRLVVSPTRRDQADCAALLHFVFQRVALDGDHSVTLSSCTCEGEFSREELRAALDAARLSTNQLFVFYRDAIRKKFSLETTALESVLI